MRRPDVLVVLADDMGFSDIGCYGGEIETPVLDGLAARGVRFAEFYNSPRCSPTRASLLTGLHPHQVGIGILTGDERPYGYRGDLAAECHTVAELLRDAGYATYLSGKWHLSADMGRPSSSWPQARGFDRTFGTIEGAGSYYDPVSLHRDGEFIDDAHADADFYYTDAIGTHGARYVADHQRERPDDSLFLYLPFTAPHWPLHARPEEVERYRGRFDAGWDELREQRRQRMVASGILDEAWPLSERDPDVPAWEDVPDKQWQVRRMEAYAAQVSAMDRAIGFVVGALADAGRLENTLILFLSDNGGCAEELPPGDGETFWDLPMVPQATRDDRPMRYGNDPQIVPGAEDTYASYGPGWANVSNTPFREYKHWVHEGGIATPLIVHWPSGLGVDPRLCATPAQLVDLLPTILAVTGADYPAQRDGVDVPPPEGASLLGALRGEERSPVPLFWEHEGNAAVRTGQWKLARRYPGPWELYDLHADRTETIDLSADRPGLVAGLADAYRQWARRVGVIPREQVLAGHTADAAEVP